MIQIIYGECMDAGGEEALLSSRRRLAGELRRLRDSAGLSGRQLAEQIGISQSKVSRIESASTLPSAQEVSGWGAATGAADAIDMLRALADAAYTEVFPWAGALRDRPHLQADIAEIERRTRAELTYESSVVPGLLQTAEYARRVFAMFDPPYAAHDLPVVVTARLDRQTALFSQARQFEFLITEAALRWRVGPAHVLLAQLDRIASLGTLENVSIGLIPHTAPALTHTPHGFVIFDPAEPETDALVMVETVHANLTVSDPLQVALYQRHWELLKPMAAYGDEAREMLARIAADLHTLPAAKDVP